MNLKANQGTVHYYIAKKRVQLGTLKTLEKKKVSY